MAESKTNFKKAINIIVLIIGGMLVAFLGFVYIGSACGLGIANQISSYLDDNLGIVISWSGLLGIFAAYRKLASMDISSDSLKNFSAASWQAIKDSKEDLDKVSSELANKVNELNELKTEIGNISEKQVKTNEELSEMFDILLYFVLDGNQNSKVEELKSYFQQSEIMKSIKEMKNVAGDNANSKDLVEAAINTASQEIKKAKAKIYKS